MRCCGLSDIMFKLLFLVAVAGWPFLTATCLTIAERGRQAGCAIVVPSTASPSQKYAAEELRDFVARVTGVKLSIRTDDEAMPPSAILLGQTCHTDRLLADPSFDVTTLGTDGFRIVARPPHFLVVASPVRGTLYGVYELLERFAGCRWYTSWHSVIPSRNRIVFPDAIDEVHKPAFEMRESFWMDVSRNPEFAARLRVNNRSWCRTDEKYGGDTFRFGGGLSSCHTFDRLLPASKHFDAHPEWFSLVNGIRRKDRTQLCLTNPEVLRIVTSNVLERIRRDPTAKFYGVSQNDWGNYCECPSCKAIDDEEESHAGTVIRFVNAIAEEVEKEFPNALIETLAYEYTRTPPKKTRLRKNVIVCLCSDKCDTALPLDKSLYPANVSFCRDIDGWRRQTDSLYVWDYPANYLNYVMPYPNVCSLQDNIRFFRRNNVKMLFEQGAYRTRHADFCELKAWLLSKWMWNPELPMSNLLDDFFAGYYGKGAPFVRKYFDELHQRQREYAKKSGKPLLGSSWIDNPALSNSFLEEAAALWRQAESAVKDDAATSYNVRMGAFSVDALRLDRSFMLLYLTKHVYTKLSPIDLQMIAKSLFKRMDEAGNIRLAEGDSTARLEKWRYVADGGALSVGRDSGEIEERFFNVVRRGTWGDYVKDSQASDGRAVKLFNTHTSTCVSFHMRNVMFDKGARYRLRARIRVEKAKVGTGVAFRAYIRENGSNKILGEINPSVSEIKDGYVWYDVLTWTPKWNDFFYMAPGGKGDESASAIKAAYLDKIEFVRAQLIGD